MATYGDRAGRVVSALAGGTAGLIVAVIVVLNLHILVGLEHGYAAGPREVWDASAALAVVDVALFAAGPLVGVLLVISMSGRAASHGRRRRVRPGT